jgi:serine/threonine protein kinase
MNVEREVDILHSLRHPRVLTLMGVCRDLSPTEGNLGLVFELMSGGSLYDLLHGGSEDAAAPRPSDLMSKLSLCLDISGGMHFLHNSKILHRDLKSANVLIDGEGRCKIGDLGLSTFKDSTLTQTAGLLATPAWTDPEVIKGEKKHSEASDMYFFGVVVWEVFSGEVPWDGVSMVTVVAWTGYEGRRLPIPYTFPAAVRGLFSSSFKDSTQRPSFASAVDLFQDLLNDQNGRKGTSSAMPSDERIRQIVEQSVREGIAPLHDALSRDLEGRSSDSELCSEPCEKNS